MGYWRLKINKDRFLDVLAIYGSDMEKWPIGLKKDIEEILKSSPELLEVLKEEKEFEDLMNTHTVQELTRSPEDEVVDLDEAEDINTTKQND